MPKLVRSHEFVVRRKATHYPLLFELLESERPRSRRPEPQSRRLTTYSKVKRGFTLIELLVVIAIVGVLAAAILVAINPGKRMAQARDAQRKQDIAAISNALAGYYTLLQNYPTEGGTCESSKGRGPACPQAGNDWGTAAGDYIYQNLIVNQAFLKKLPIDPKNDSTYYYRYEPAADQSIGTDCSLASGNPCLRYWIGARLEAIDDPTKEGKMVFRCTDYTNLGPVAGCREVEYPNATGANSFDEFWRIY